MANYPKYCVQAGISRRDMIEVLKKKFPKYEKMTQTVVCNPDDYGAQLIPEAEELLVTSFGFHEGLSLKKRRNHGNAKKPNRLCVRLDDALYAAFETAFCNSSFLSKQDMIEAAICYYLNRRDMA